MFPKSAVSGNGIHCSVISGDIIIIIIPEVGEIKT